MSYIIQYSVRAAKELKKLDHEIGVNIIKALDRIRIRPYEFVQKIVGTNYYRLKVGNYRIIMDIISNEMNILVIRVGHRRDVYKKK